MTRPAASDEVLIEGGVLTLQGEAGPLVKTATWTYRLVVVSKDVVDN